MVLGSTPQSAAACPVVRSPVVRSPVVRSSRSVTLEALGGADEAGEPDKTDETDISDIRLGHAPTPVKGAAARA
jgi:hypothetical protein